MVVDREGGALGQRALPMKNGATQIAQRVYAFAGRLKKAVKPHNAA
jgi:hypothetical protein